MTQVSHTNHTDAGSLSHPMDNGRLASLEQAIIRAQSACREGDDSSDAWPPKPSALRVAILRAAHQLLDAPLVFEDPFALSILGAEGEALLRSDPSLCQSPPPNAFRAALVLRARYAEDQWAQEHQSGVRQYVVLGAGLDTFAYRNADHRCCRIFEVDLPGMVQWKRECLRMAGIPEPDSLTFVPTDFERDSLAESLRQAGYDANTPAFFSWMGVTFYLDEDAVTNTLRFVGSQAPGSGIVFDYAVHSRSLSPQEQQAMERLNSRMAGGGEPWTTQLDPVSLLETLRALGFTAVNDLGPDEINTRYMSGRTDGMRKTGLTRIIYARV